MSKLGKIPVQLPKNVKFVVNEGSFLVEGPKGKISRKIPEGIKIETEDGRLVVKRSSDDRQTRAYHGLTRSLLSAAVKGASEGYSKTLVAVGVGYRMAITGSKLTVSAGFSHPVNFTLPTGVAGKVDDQTKLTLSGVDRELVGMVADKIRMIRPPEPYKGKGIRYEGEEIQLKEGKSGAGGKGA
jgi:large subunit ribosomal protein L6